MPVPIEQTLLKVEERLRDTEIKWAVTGSLGFALQGLVLEVGDIDLQTDESGAYAMAARCAEWVIPVLALEYEYESYVQMGRLQKAQMLRDWLERRGPGSSETG
jgi:hypothetical protein